MTAQPLPGDVGARFQALLVTVEPSLRRALIAAYGPDAGREAAAEALVWAWEHRAKVEAMSNPGGYLWRVGQTAARKGRRWSSRRADIALLPDVAAADDRHPPEPRLAAALAGLTHHQRAAVVLVHGWGYTLDAAADAIECRVSTLRNHLQRGLTKLQATMGADDD